MPVTSSTRPVPPVRTRLTELAGWLGIGPDAGTDAGTDAGSDLRVAEVEVTGLSLSSQRIEPGDLYAALPGARAHGAVYAADAVAGGAVAVLTDPEGRDLIADQEPTTPERTPVLVVDDVRRHLGALAARVYGHPADGLTLIGVTGTQGKTTTTRLAGSGMEHAGITSAVVGTVGTRIAGTEVHTSLTTPEAPDLHALFAVMRQHDVTACAMEVSSHALVKGRVDGVVFDVAVFTNLGRDHLDFHASVEDYFAAKASLFTPQRARRALVNVDDEHGRRLLGLTTLPVRTFSARGADADWRAVDVRATPEGTDFVVHGPGGVAFAARSPLAGDFNVANTLAAIAAVGEAGLDAAAVATGIGRGGGVPGRLERVDAGQDWLGIVDYAHKPDAVEAALGALRPLTAGRLLVVIGAGGDRDQGKRPLMGEVAARLADVLVVTDDNPRSEDPARIRAEVLAGAGPGPDSRSDSGSDSGTAAEVHEVAGRRAAIALAVSLARAGDTVLIAGKGHESGQEVAGVVHPFDDRTVLRELAGTEPERPGS